MTSPYYTVNEAAEILCVTRKTIERRMNDRTLTRVRFGGRVLIPRAEVDALEPKTKRRRAA